MPQLERFPVACATDSAQRTFHLLTSQAPPAHERLQEMLQILSRFHIMVFDQASAEIMERLRRRHRRRKRYADLLAVALQHLGYKTKMAGG